MHPREVPHALGVLGPVGVGVEVPHAVPAGVLEQADQVEGVADAFGSEAEVLVVLPDPLRVEVDVEQLPLPQGLGDGVRERESRHGLVGELGVEADHVGPLELADERQRVADGREEEVTARLVRLGLERDAQVVAALADVLAAQVDGFLVPVERGAHVLGRVGLHPLATAPHHVDVRAQLGAEIDGVERLAHREPTDVAIVRRERALLEHGSAEQVGRRHRHVHAGLVERGAEPLQDRLALGRRSAVRHEVVVVEADAVRTEIREAVHRVDRVEGRAHLVTERVATGVAHRPQVRM